MGDTASASPDVGFEVSFWFTIDEFGRKWKCESMGSCAEVHDSEKNNFWLKKKGRRATRLGTSLQKSVQIPRRTITSWLRHRNDIKKNSPNSEELWQHSISCNSWLWPILSYELVFTWSSCHCDPWMWSWEKTTSLRRRHRSYMSDNFFQGCYLWQGRLCSNFETASSLPWQHQCLKVNRTMTVDTNINC